MTEQVQREHVEQPREPDEQSTDIPGKAARDRAAAVSADTDDLLDDIDELLNEMPQDLATQFVQANGE